MTSSFKQTYDALNRIAAAINPTAFAEGKKELNIDVVVVVSNALEDLNSIARSLEAIQYSLDVISRGPVSR